MSPLRNKKKFQQPTVEDFRLREGGFFYRATGARVQRNSFTVMRVREQWTDKHRATRKSWQWTTKVHVCSRRTTLTRMRSLHGKPSMAAGVCNRLMSTEPG
ncbi:hypothetical protein TNCV_3115741 [Trichonephila clavipes]|nr:hypothetical protein TNCV_3115741 [Trichonephila clavipes]